MRSTIISQNDTEKTRINTASPLRELASIFTMFSVTATIVLLSSLTWIA